MTDEEFIARKLTEFFKEEPHKAVLWMMLENPLLGNLRPTDLITLGKVNKLRRFVESLIEGNFP